MAPVLLYDGVCGFCNGAVQTILRFDRHGTLRFAAVRYRVFGRYDTCPVPPPEVRARFVS